MTITPELEAVARAICRENLISTRQPTDAETINSYWPSFVKEARTALMAIREPTDGMRDRAYNACAMNDQWCIEDDEHWARTHRASIDYILSETKP